MSKYYKSKSTIRKKIIFEDDDSSDENELIDKNELYDDICNEYVEMSEKLLSKIIKQKQTYYENQYYPNAQMDTKMKCIFCGGSYTKRNRCIHNKTNKHLLSIGLIKKYLSAEY